MSNYTINYIVYTPGHRRRHAGSQTQLIPPASGVSNSGEHFPVFAFPFLPYMDNNLSFAFMSVVGNADHTHLYTTPGNKDVLTGTNDIRITIVYAPGGGSGGDGHGGPGIWVDAFNVNTGEFSDSDFMQVFTKGVLDNDKTFTANEDGVVSSATGEDLRAYNTMDSLPFLEWLKIGTEPLTTVDYMLEQNEEGIAFAFFSSADPLPISRPETYPEGWIFVSPGVLTGAGGFVIDPITGVPHPIDPKGAFIAQLLTAHVIVSLIVNMSADVAQQAYKLVAAHLDSIKDSLLNQGIK